MNMLKYVVTQMVKRLQANNIFLPDNIIKIWIKEMGPERQFPKIEFDMDSQELQYELDTNGTIKEKHFKSWVHSSTGALRRYDIEKHEASALLQSIDNILCPYEPM